jgi:hypothetical protein
VLESEVKWEDFRATSTALEQERVLAKIWFLLHENQLPMHPIYSTLEGLRSNQQINTSMAGFEPANISNS